MTVLIPNDKLTATFLLFPYPGEQFVEPSNRESEPTVLCHGLATEAKDELSERIVGIGQPGIEEVDVGIVVFPRPNDRLPHGHHCGMKPGVTLAQRSEIPQIGIPFGIDTDAATNQPTLVEGGKEAAIVAEIELSNLLLRRYDTMHLPAIEATHQMSEAVEILFRGHLTGFDTLLIGMLNLFQHFGL